MKKALKNWINYVIGFALFLSAFLLGILPAYAIKYSWFGVQSGAATWNPEYPTLFGAALFLLIGFIWQDLYKANYRRKEKNWDGELPLEIKDKAWARCTALYIGALLCLICAFVYLIICLVMKVDTIFTIL